MLKLFIVSLLIITTSCISQQEREVVQPKESTPITCTTKECSGKYIGPEFVNGSDVAHQFSNTMSKVVGDKLKEFYRNQEYKKIDINNIIMTTEGMGSGSVNYYLSVPFIEVKKPCEAYTSFDHVGGWNHRPELQKRINQLTPLLLKDQSLDISKLHQTDEGLQEYWIQWKNNKTQKGCI